MENIASNAYKLKIQIKSMEKQYESLMSCLKESYAQGQTRWGSYELTQTSRPGSVDYSSIPELKAVDLERYRKESINVYKLEYLGE